ncbi:MAG: hypothetical protein P8016_17465 [Sedimentisphaerales bacterium]
MLRSELMNFINNIEVKYPVDQWSLDGIQVWPLIRILLGFYMLKREENCEAPKNLGKLSSLGKQVNQLIKSNLKYGYAYLYDFKNNYKSGKPCDAVFLSDGISFCKLRGAWFEKYCDPIIKALKENSISSLLLSIVLQCSSSHIVTW